MEQGHCNLCRGLSLESLNRPKGYLHAATAEELRESAKTCKMCRIIDASLDKKKPDDASISGPLICRLNIPGEGERFKAALEVTGCRQHGVVQVYTHGM